MTTPTTRHATLEVPYRQSTSGGYEDDTGRHYLTRVAVEDDGTVLAWDDVGEIFTRHHDLTEAQQAEARRIAR